MNEDQHPDERADRVQHKGVRARKITQSGHGNTFIAGDQVNQGSNSTYVGYAEQIKISLSEHAEPLAQIPPDIADFTGRRRELAELKRLLTVRTRGHASAVVISAVAGKPGVGKSALAVHVAHQVIDEFIDGQLYANLRGADDKPRTTEEVLEEFLRIFGVVGDAMPQSVDAKAALYRERLAGKRVLIILDNAANEHQVRPLLPSGPPCVVVVTSRAPLTTLGAHLLQLDVLDPPTAVALLANVVGDERIQSDGEQAAQLARLCGHLPLALRIAGAKLRSRPDWAVRTVVQRLSSERRRLARLGEGDLDVRASFMLSYVDLDSKTARTFRLLGLIPGPDFGSLIVATLTATELAEAEDQLDSLVRLQLVEPAPGVERYRFHDLLRLFSTERLEADESRKSMRSAGKRLQGWYLDAAEATAAVLYDSGSGLLDVSAEAGVDPTAVLAWLDMERPGLLAATEMATQTGTWSIAGRMTSALQLYLRVRGSLEELERTQVIGLEAAKRTRNRPAIAAILNHLGTTYVRQGRWNEAASCFKKCLKAIQSLDDRQAEAHILSHLGLVYYRQGRTADALAYLKRAGEAVQQLEDRHGESHVLFHLGYVYSQLEQWTLAATCYEECLAIERAFRDRHAEAETLARLSVVYSAQERWGEAVAILEQGLEAFRELGDRQGEAHNLLHLSSVYFAQDDRESAVASLNRCLEIHRDLDDRHGQHEVLDRLGSIYAAQEQWNDATACLNESVEIARSLADPRREAESLRQLSHTYAAQERWGDAVACLEQLVEIMQFIGHPYGQARALANLSFAYVQLKRRTDAIRFGEHSLSILQDLGSPEAERISSWLDNLRGG
jgi:tetratricopeptide (TPR) repeat protein